MKHENSKNLPAQASDKADSETNPFAGMTIISVYTRAQAIEDGVLIDVSKMAREVALARGINFGMSVAMTEASWRDCVEWPKERGDGQDEDERLWDVLWMAFYAMLRAPKGACRIKFVVNRVPPTSKYMIAKEVKLAMEIGPGDEGEPVITIMQPHED